MLIETKRLVIRDFRESDFEDYFHYMMDAKLQELLGMTSITDRASALDAFRWLLANRLFLALELRTSEQVIGHICLHPPFTPVAESEEFFGKNGASISCALSSAMQKQGYMAEALAALFDYNRQTGKWDYFDYEYEPANLGSKRLQEKLGFREWGTEAIDDIVLHVCVYEKTSDCQ